MSNPNPTITKMRAKTLIKRRINAESTFADRLEGIRNILLDVRPTQDRQKTLNEMFKASAKRLLGEPPQAGLCPTGDRTHNPKVFFCYGATQATIDGVRHYQKCVKRDGKHASHPKNDLTCPLEAREMILNDTMAYTLHLCRRAYMYKSWDAALLTARDRDRGDLRQLLHDTAGDASFEVTHEDDTRDFGMPSSSLASPETPGTLEDLSKVYPRLAPWQRESMAALGENLETSDTDWHAPESTDNLDPASVTAVSVFSADNGEHGPWLHLCTLDLNLSRVPEQEIPHLVLAHHRSALEHAGLTKGLDFWVWLDKADKTPVAVEWDDLIPAVAGTNLHVGCKARTTV